MGQEKQELLNFVRRLEENELDSISSDETLLNLIISNKHDVVLLQCLHASDRTSLLELCSRLHLQHCQEYLLKNGIFDPHILTAQCEMLAEACRYGFSNVVKLLLLNKVKMSSQPICTPNSPFYIATHKGYVDILQLMVDSDPCLIKKDVRKTLLLVACMGGHLDAVKFWFKFRVLPSKEFRIDSNSRPEKHQHDPLYVACKGKHMDVIKYLVDKGFPWSEEICKKFPDVIEKFLLMDYDTNSSQLEINWTHLHLPLFLRDWVQSIQMNITILNVSYNKLSCLPGSVPWEMPNLVTFNASNNSLTMILGPEADILCQRLEILILSHNKLKMLCSEIFQIPSLKEVYVANNQLVFLTKDEELFHGFGKFFSKDDVPRNCPNLSILNLSHNTLQRFPKLLPSCPNLTKFYASHNQLCDTFDPWSCPLDTLNLSHNLLSEIPSSLENFWTSSLQYIDLSYNQLTEVSESIVSLYSLTELNISNNNIMNLPACKSWGCDNLKVLNLGHNNLGQSTESSFKKPSLFKWSLSDETEGFDLIIPKNILQSLTELNLESNGLTTVPPSISKMKSLVFLTLSSNPAITRLPEELGLLESCKQFFIKGLDIGNVPKEIQEVDKNGTDILQFLQYKRRNSKPHWCMKLSVMGPEGKGKTTLIKGLTKGNMSRQQTCPGLSTCRWTTEKKWKISSSSGSISQVTFNVWEFSKPEKFSDIHNCFISKNSLFLLVWDVNCSVEELEPFLMSIEAKAKHAEVMIVGTFIDHVVGTKEEFLKMTFLQIKELHNRLNMSLILRGLWVTCPPVNTGIKELATEIVIVAKNMKLNHNKGELFLCRRIPQSYISLARKIEQDVSKTHCFEDEFKNYVEEMEGNDIISHNDLQQASIFLHEIGDLLYHPEFNSSSLYFFNPVWLFDLLGKIFTDQRLKSYFVQQGKLCLRRSKAILDSFLPQEDKLEYLDLLETFGIGLRMDKDMLFVPSVLLEGQPGTDMGCYETKLVRLIKIGCIPPGFWNQLMIQVMLIIELLKENMFMTYRFSYTQNFRRYKQKQSLHNRERSYEFRNTQMIYWKKGLIVTYETGNFQICIKKGGIQVTVQTSTKDYSMMGILMNELEILTENICPGLINDFSIYAACPLCYSHTSDSKIIQNVDHFCIEQCAYMLTTSFSIKCTSGHKILLEDLIPELLLMHIPSYYHLNKNEIECMDFIACGVSGSVFVGQYKKQNVALKFYQKINKVHASQTSRGSSLKNSWKQKSTPKMVDAREFKDNLKEFVEGKLLMQKIQELQHEVLLLSHLKHPCIISLVGFILQPLCLVLELAPMRSLRLVMNSHLKNQKKQQVLFPKMLTYRILLQVAEGLNYLHQKGIIYRDLKTDNILVWSLQLDCKVNVKLSDYNFSRYSTMKGMSTPAGTPGYQAPEILAKRLYNEKVDVYAWSMVAYEVQSGLLPFQNLQSTFQISEAVLAKKRPSLKALEIESRFPCLDKLMTLSHDHSASLRPTASNIVSNMKKMSFLFLKNITIEPLTTKRIDAQYVFNNEKGHQTIWLWEGELNERKYFLIDTTSQSVTYNSFFPGSRVISQTNINKSIWLATQNEEIEIVGIEHQRFQLRIIETLKLPSMALVMQSQEDKNRVYIGTLNGTLLIFYKNLTRLTDSESVSCWEKISLEISENHQPITTLEILDEEIWVSCGQNVHIVCLKDLNVTETLTLPYLVASCISTSSRQVFYTFKDSAIVLQLDVASRQIMFVYDFQHINMTGKIAVTTSPGNSKLGSNGQELDSSSGKDQPDCSVMSVLLVGDALWVGRDIGDILIVSINERFAYEVGFVITALKPNYLLPHSERLLSVRGLECCTDKSVFSLVEAEDGNLVKVTRIGFWEQYNTAEIFQIQNHIKELVAEEKKIY